MSLIFFFVIGLQSIRTASETSVAEQGDPVCPCITAQEGASDAINDTHLLDLGLTSAEKVGYGIGCARHDAREKRCRVNEPPSFCSHSWCYVSDECGLRSVSSTIRKCRWYSYATCGYLDRYATDMREQKLKVVVLSNSGGWKGSYCKQETDCTGPTEDIFRTVLDDANAGIHLVGKFGPGISTNVDEVYPAHVMQALRRDKPDSQSASWACWYATGMGFVDICMYAATGSSARKSLSKSVYLYSEPLYLVTTQLKKKSGILDHLFRAFDPFKGEVWVGIFCFLLLAAYVLAWQERNPGGEYDGMSVKSVFADSSYRGLRSLVDGGCSFEPGHAGGRLTALGIGFFLLIIINSYTANLASILVQPEKSTLTVTSWRNLLENPSWTVCVDDGIADILTRPPLNLPQAQALIYKSRTDVNENIGTLCEAAVVGLEDLDAFHAEDSSHCNIVRVGDPLVYMSHVAPVSDRAYNVLQYHFAFAQEGGAWHSTLERWKPRDTCKNSEDQDLDDDDIGLKFEDVSGAFFVSGAPCILGSIVTCASSGLGKFKPTSPSAEQSSYDEGSSSNNKILLDFTLSQLKEIQKRLSASLEGTRKDTEGSDMQIHHESTDASPATLTLANSTEQELETRVLELQREVSQAKQEAESSQTNAHRHEREVRELRMAIICGSHFRSGTGR